jgi:putative oxidoreductase
LIARWQSAAPQILSVLRIVAAFLFILPGTMKLFGLPMAMPPGVSASPLSEVWFAGALEVVGGGLLLIGLFTRPVAFLLSGEMAVAYFQAHAPNGFWPLANGGTDAVFFCFVWLYLSAAGAGPWSVDAIMVPAWSKTTHSKKSS